MKAGRLSRACGIVTLAGCATVLAADLVGASLSDHIGLVSDTISDLAAGGRWDWLMDAGLYSFAVAVLATALGISRWHIAGWDWKLGQVLLVVLAADITAIAAYEAYSRDGAAPNLHRYFVYLIGIAFPLMVCLTSRGFGEAIGWLKPALRGFAILWALAGPFLFATPTAWDGLYERILAGLMVAWFALVGWLLWRRAGAAQA